MSAYKDFVEYKLSWEVQDHAKFISFVNCISYQDSNETEVENLVKEYNWNNPVARLKPFLHPEMTKAGPCELKITFPYRHQLRVKQARVLSNARHLELYDKSGEYVATFKGNKVSPAAVASNDHGTGTIHHWFDTEIEPITDSNEIIIKFIGLADVGFLAVRQVWIVTTVHAWPGHEPGAASSAINLDRVADLLGGDLSVLTPQARQLLTTIDMAQKSGSNASPLVMANLLSSLQLGPVGPAAVGSTVNTAQPTQSISSGGKKDEPDSIKSRQSGTPEELHDWIDKRLATMENNLLDTLSSLSERLTRLENLNVCRTCGCSCNSLPKNDISKNEK